MTGIPRISPPSRRWWTRRRGVVAITILAAILRLWAAWQLPVDYDEPVYMKAAFDYAAAIRAGDWKAVIDYAGNREHPPLVKLLYGAGVLALGEGVPWDGALLAGRLISAAFGSLAVLALSLADPLAGAMLAVDTLAVKYTSQAYLEALPLFACIVAVLALRRSAGRDRWLYLSAAALGLALAGKLAYLPIVFAIGFIGLWEKPARRSDLVPYLALAVAVFLLLNPTLWREPLPRLAEALTYHAEYARSAHVQQVAYPWFQPILWVAFSVPWHPEVFFYGGLDGLFFLLAVGGAWWQWRERRWAVVWAATSLLALLAWPTKWPQYALVVVPALCLMAAGTARRLYRWAAEQEAYWEWLRQMMPVPTRAFWIGLGLVALAFTGIYVAVAVQTTLEQRRWTHITSANTPLPGNAVRDIAPLPDGRMILGTNAGAAIWSPPGAEGLESWPVLTRENSGLPDDDVLAVAADPSGAVWFGTASGLARYAGGRWQVFRASDMGVGSDRVLALAVGADGRLWVGTQKGAAAFDGATWTPLPPESGIAGALVLSIAVEPTGRGVWFGTGDSVVRLDTATGMWVQYTPQNSPLGMGGVADLMVDSGGHVWAATLGGGLGVWDGSGWRVFNVGNSRIPSNTVQEVCEDAAGTVWVGFSWPMEFGGALASFDGRSWKRYFAGLSGFSGSEALAIAQDGLGRIWVGTQSAGVDVYSP